MDTAIQKRKIRFPLALKLVGLTSLLVMTVAGTIAWKNSQLFSQISSDREEANVEMVTSSKTLEVEAILESYFEKLSLLAFDDKNRVMGSDIAYFKVESTNPAAMNERANANISPEDASEFRQMVSTLKSESALVQSGRWYVSSTGMDHPDLLVELGYTREQAMLEASRCLDCGVTPVFDGARCVLCGGCADVCPTQCLKLVPLSDLAPELALGDDADRLADSAILKDEDRCIRCALCAMRCPVEAISMERAITQSSWRCQ